jgi:hypothetical protein
MGMGYKTGLGSKCWMGMDRAREQVLDGMGLENRLGSKCLWG